MPNVGGLMEIGGWTKENYTIINEEKIEEVENDDILGIARAEQQFPMSTFRQFSKCQLCKYKAVTCYDSLV